MVDLSPAPASLGIASPALGPWFQVASSDNDDLGPISLPDADLGCPLNLPSAAIWNAPASGLLSFLLATDPRPPALASLRQADGSPAFADGAFVLLFTLLPEVAERLGALVQAVPRADDASAAAAGVKTRPVINRFALELPPGTITSLGDLSNILPDKDAADLKQVYDALSDTDKPGFLGMTFNAGFANADKPVTILRRPETDDGRLLENRSGGALTPKLWAFDKLGRPYDAGALAAMWAHLAEDDWDNLWASDDTDRQRTAARADGRIVHLVNAHEGPLEAPIKARINGQLTDLTARGTSDVLFEAGANPAIGFSASADADTDTAPLARLSPLPAGPYAAPTSATPFAGWSDAAALSRDFLRVAITDIEAMTVGLPRSANTRQADPRRRISPARNTADTLFLSTSDAVASAVMDLFETASATVQFIAPELDSFYGPQTIAARAGGNPFDEQWDDPAFTAHAIAGSGSVTATIAEDQSVAIHFDESLPPESWVRAWPHGRDTDTGRRFRMTGGAARVDGSGSAVIFLPLPNGRNSTSSNTERFSFDLQLVTDEGARLFTDRRADRPAVDEGSAIDITTLAAGQSLYCPQTGGTLAAGNNAIPPGAPLLVVPDVGGIGAHDYTAIDRETLRAADMSAVLTNRADRDDLVITHDPAFVQTSLGDLPETQQPGGPARVHDGGFHTSATAQSMRDFAGYDTTGNIGVVGAVSAREEWHEAPPPALAHPGVSASSEIHAQGVAIAGPAADQLRLLMRERAADGVVDFISNMGTPFTPAAAVTTPGPWTAILETAAKGTHGHALMGAIPPSFNPGETWDNADPANPGIKQQIDEVLEDLPGTISTDSIIDTANFDDTTAAAAFDRVLSKHRGGAQDFARVAIAAISRAEDLIWLQTPALDNEEFDHDDGDIHFLEAISDRLQANPALHCLLIIPEKHLPDRNTKLDSIRKLAAGAALKHLDETLGDRFAWISPNAAPGRKLHSSATTLIVDDAVMISGAAHCWRRGLVFDSALSVSIFDELLDDGRPRAIANARDELSGNLLGIEPGFVPKKPSDLIKAARLVNSGGGFLRANPTGYLLKDDPTDDAEKAIWNPAVSAGTDWAATLAGLSGDIEQEIENGTR